jgi:hypothetical protein
MDSNRKDYLLLKCGAEHRINLNFRSDNLGTFRFLNLLLFTISRQTLVVRLRHSPMPYHLAVNVGSEEDMKILQPIQEYSPYEPDEAVRRIIPGRFQ